VKSLFLDLGSTDVGGWYQGAGIHERWQDLGAGQLLTQAEQGGHHFDCVALPGLHSWAELRMVVKGYDLLAMNVRNWRFENAVRAARIAKSANPNIRVWTGGFHATVALDEMEPVEHFDLIVRGQADRLWPKLLADRPTARVMEGDAAPYLPLDDIPWIDRTLWPRVPYPHQADPWPLDGYCGWTPGPKIATLQTARGCPFTCKFCWPTEKMHYGGCRRRSVGNVIGELKMVDQRWGPINSVVFHDAEFLMGKPWLEEFCDRYPRETPGWPFWAAGRADMIARWPDLVSALVKEANWAAVSIGFESGSDRVLQILGKGTTRAQNDYAIDLMNRLGDEMVAEGRAPVKVFANLMQAIPGEEPEDAIETLRMAGRLKRGIPSFAWFTPSRGNALGEEIRAAGRALNNDSVRFPGRAKVAGVDYQFYVDLMNGRYDREVGFSVQRMMAAQGGAGWEREAAG
jgi:radical SAM superfamily enzyme YgiQ (UPF0313 family)